MNDLTVTISVLKAKVEKLVSLHQQLKKDNEQLYADKESLQTRVNDQQKMIESLQKINQEITHSKSEEQTKIVVDTKFKIDELVQEIDDCIALLK